MGALPSDSSREGSSPEELFSPGKRPTFCLLLPVLNEADALPLVLPDIDPEWVDEIVVVDGGSSDDTVRLIEEWGHADKIIHQKKKGISNAYWEAYPSIESDYIISFSPDGNSLPLAIPDLIEKVYQGYDMVVASRYLPGAGSEDDDLVTALGNRMFTMLVNTLFNANYTDTLVMLRAYRKNLVHELPMDTTAPAFEPQLNIRCAVHRCRIAEIPAYEPARVGGERKMRIIYNGWAIFSLVAREYRRKRKLRKQWNGRIPPNNTKPYRKVRWRPEG